ncbi:MAG: hypothetical protein ACRDJ5_02685, partial [Actinomycetota bacterium]
MATIAKPLPEVGGRVSRVRRIGFAAVVALVGLFIGFMMFSIPALIMGWFIGGSGQIHRVHEIGWGAFGGILISTAMFLQLWKPERKVALLQQVGLSVIAFAVAMTLVGAFEPTVLAVLALVGVAGLLHPARGELLRFEARISPILAGITALAAIPLVVYASDMVKIERAVVSSDPHEGHWTGMAALAIALILVGGLTALRTTGYRITARIVGAAALVLGVASVVFPDYASSLGGMWGSVAIFGGIAFIAAAEWE